jgi:hypothetical protein
VAPAGPVATKGPVFVTAACPLGVPEGTSVARSHEIRFIKKFTGRSIGKAPQAGPNTRSAAAQLVGSKLMEKSEVNGEKFARRATPGALRRRQRCIGPS